MSAQHGKLWARVYLEDLTSRQLDRYYPARTRLLLLLEIRSFRGKKTVRLTYAMVEAIGLDRAQKRVCLRELETDGCVTVERFGRQFPLVTVLRRRP